MARRKKTDIETPEGDPAVEPAVEVEPGSPTPAIIYPDAIQGAVSLALAPLTEIALALQANLHSVIKRLDELEAKLSTLRVVHVKPRTEPIPPSTAAVFTDSPAATANHGTPTINQRSGRIA